jgi:hypothetical protein
VNNIKHLLDVVDNQRDRVALGLMSDPGLSKTSQVKQWAEEHDRRYCELIISQRMPSEISGMPMPVTDSRRMEVFDFQTLLDLEKGDVLAFDEFTNGNIQTLNACLTLIQERTMLSGHKLPSLLITAMGNPQGKCELLPQTKQRFWWVNVGWHAPTWLQYMRTTWGIEVDKAVVEAITEQYKRGFGTSLEYNYFTPRTVENLFSIATDISVDDPFWECSGVQPKFVDALYLSINKETTFKQVTDKMHDWFAQGPDGEGITTGSENLGLFMADLMSCGSIADMREFLSNAAKIHEYDEILPQFMEYLKNNNLEKKVATEKSVMNPTFSPGKHYE